MKKPEDFGITNYDKEKFKKTGILDCFQGVDLIDRNLEKIPFQFGIVDGYFDCGRNQLKSLKGAPESVDGSFNCSGNYLKSLKGGPHEVSGDFYCSSNLLESLEGCPLKVVNVDCSQNQLKSLEGCPQELNGNFYCSQNQLKSLEGSPREVQGNFYCHNNLFDMTAKEWIKHLVNYQKGNLYKCCRIVPNNRTYKSTLKGLKEKLAILKALD